MTTTFLFKSVRLVEARNWNLFR